MLLLLCSPSIQLDGFPPNCFCSPSQVNRYTTHIFSLFECYDLGHISETFVPVDAGLRAVVVSAATYPLYVIRPFRHQGAHEFSAALAVIRFRPGPEMALAIQWPFGCLSGCGRQIPPLRGARRGLLLRAFDGRICRRCPESISTSKCSIRSEAGPFARFHQARWRPRR